MTDRNSILAVNACMMMFDACSVSSYSLSGLSVFSLKMFAYSFMSLVSFSAEYICSMLLSSVR